ncbi:MAG TPA: hypothetical protein PKL08_00870 [Thermoanaerobaculaceae bacterium]|nr:hypothetical protein [Thermoanaerobaculaceae bacterium]
MPNALDVLLVHVADPRAGGRTKTWPCPRDLRFTTTAPGGFDTLSCTLAWPDPDTAPTDVLRAGSTVTVTDRTSGDTVWYGEVDDPGSKVRPGARAYRVTATGPRRILERVTKAYALCDRDLANWTSDRTYNQSEPTLGDGTGFTAHAGDWPTDAPDGYIESLQPDGSKLAASALMTLRYRKLQDSADALATEQRAVWIFWSHISDSAHPTILNELVVRNMSGGAAQTVNTVAQAAAQLDEAAAFGTGAWTTDAKRMVLRWRYTGAAITRPDDAWTRFANVAVYFQALDKDGGLLDPNTSVNSLHVGGIMHDMLGRHLLGLVETGATVFYPNGTKIDQAEWWGGASAREIADFCQSAQPDYWWAVWEPGPSGLPRFEYRPWVTSGNGVTTNAFRYLLHRANSRVEFAGGADDVYNTALVVYEKANGSVASVVVSGAVADLTALGVDRQTTIDLTGRGPLTASSASNLGLAELAKLDAERASGTATVTGPVMDRITGCMVDPWAVLPGWLAKTAEPPEQSYPGNDLTRRDSVSQFRVTSVTFDAASNTAELALDGGSRSVFRRRRSPAAPLPSKPRYGDGPVGMGKKPIKRK